MERANEYRKLINVAKKDVWQRSKTDESEIRLEPRSRSVSHGADDSPRFRVMVEHGVNVQDKHRRHRVRPNPADERGSSSAKTSGRKETSLTRF